MSMKSPLLFCSLLFVFFITLLSNGSSGAVELPASTSKAEAQRRSDLAEFGSIQARIRSEASDNFAGVYVNASDQLVVRFRGDAEAQLKRFSGNPRFVASEAPRSLVLLEAVAWEALEILTREQIGAMTAVDVERSRVIVTTDDLNAATAALREFVKQHPFIDFEVSSLPQPMSGNGGMAWRGQRNCPSNAVLDATTGFNVVDNVPSLLLTAAGHSAGSMDSVDGQPIDAILVGDLYEGHYDVAFYRQRFTRGVPSRTQTNVLMQPTELRVTGIRRSFQLVPTQDVCKYGIATQKTCGVFDGMVNMQLRDRNNCFPISIGRYMRVKPTKLFTMLVSGGDSGAPVYVEEGTGAVALGIAVAGDERISSGYYGYLWVMPVERFEELGFQVLTVPFEIASVSSATGSQSSLIPFSIEWTGTPLWPLDIITEVVSCPPTWSCQNWAGDIWTPQTPPFVKSIPCSGPMLAGRPPGTITYRTKLVGPDLVATQWKTHSVTC